MAISFYVVRSFNKLNIGRHLKIHNPIVTFVKVKDKVIPVTGHGGPYGCETSRLPHFLDSWLTDGGEVVSLMF
jgi:hypothetical protein